MSGRGSTQVRDLVIYRYSSLLRLPFAFAPLGDVHLILDDLEKYFSGDRGARSGSFVYDARSIGLLHVLLRVTSAEVIACRPTWPAPHALGPLCVGGRIVANG